jgi:hypothetical protein
MLGANPADSAWVMSFSGLSELTKTLFRSTGLRPAAKTISTGIVEVRPIIDGRFVGWAKYLGLH